MAVRENIKDPLGILAEDSKSPDPLGILKKKEVSNVGTSSTSPSKSTSDLPLTAEQRQKEIDYLNSPQANSGKPLSEHPVTFEKQKEVRQIEQHNHVAKLQNINESIKTSPDLESAIFKFNNVKDPNRLSGTKKAQLLDNTLNDEDFNNAISQNDQLTHDARIIKDNLVFTSPDYAAKKIEQKIGQHIQDSGKNSLLYEHKDQDEMNSIVDNMIEQGKLTPQEKLFYTRNKEFVNNAINQQSPDLAHSLKRGIQSGVAGVESSLRDIGNKATAGVLQDVGLIETNEDRTSRMQDEQANTPQIDPKTFGAKAVKGVGEFTGYVAPMIINTLLTKGAGMSETVAEVAPALLQFEGQNADRARELFQDDKKSQLMYTLMGTGIDVTLGKLLPTGKIANSITGLIKKDVVKAVSEMTEDNAANEVIKKNLLNKITSIIGDVAKNNTTTAATVTAYEGLHDILDKAFGKRDFTAEDEGKQLLETFKSSWLSSTGLSLGGAALAKIGGTPKLQGKVISEVADNPQEHIERAEDAAKMNPQLEPQVKDVVQNIQDASKAWGVIKELPLNEAQKEKLLVKEMQQKVLDKAASEAPIDVMKSELQDKANEAFKEKVQIYNGTDQAQEHQDYQPKLKTPEEIEPEIAKQIGDEKAKQATKEVNEIAEYDLFPEGLPTYEKEAAKQYPLQFLKEVSDQLHTVDKVEEGKTASPRETTENKYGKDIVKLAEEYFPHEKDKLPNAEEGEVPANAETNKIVEPAEEAAGGQPPKEGAVVLTPEESRSGITHAATAETRKEIGFPEYEGKEVESHEELREYAKKAIAEDPTIADKTMTKIEKGGKVTNKDNAILAEYKSAIDFELENRPSKEVFEKAKRLIDVLEPSGTELGKALESRKLLNPKEDNLTNFLVDKQMAQGTGLTDKQIIEQTKEYKDLKQAKDDLEAALKVEREKSATLAAEKEFEKTKPTRSTKKGNHEDYVTERKDLKTKLKEQKEKHLQWLKDQGIQQQGFGGFVLTSDMAKTIGQIVKSHLNEGVQKLGEVVDKVIEDIKDIFPEVTKGDIMEVISGKYNEPKRTENEVAAQSRLLKREAGLLKDLADAKKGIEKEKNEKKVIEKNRRIEELERKIAEVRKLGKEPEPVHDETAHLKNNAEQLAAQRKTLLNKIGKLEQDLKDKKFLKEKPREPKIKLDSKTRALMDRVIELEKKRNEELAKDQYSQRSKWQKVYDKAIEFASIRRIVQSALDLSVSFRQGATLLSPRKFGVWLKSFGAQLNSVFSQKNYDRLMYGIRHSEDYHDMVKDGISFNELDSIKPEQRNEDFQKSFIYKIPILREPLLASNRAADSFLNTARYELYMKSKAMLERQGKTRQSDPKAYEDAAKWAMNMTGRGNLLGALEHNKAQKVLGNTFYGARLMASRFNILNPATYIKMAPEARLAAMKDIGAFASTVIVAGLAGMAAGGKVSFNPDDSDFLQLRFGDHVIDLTGGLAIYLRTYSRIVHAGYMKGNPNVTKYESDKATEKAGQSVMKFFRNKLAPNTGYAADAYFGKSGGQKFDPYEPLEIYPMYVDDTKKALNHGGISEASMVLAINVLGLGYGNYGSKGSIDSDLSTLLERNLRSNEQNIENLKNYKDKGRDVTNKEFNEYVDKRDAKIKEGIEKLYNDGALVIEDNKVVKKKYADLTREQVVKETSSIKLKATKETKEELFGTHEKTRDEKRAEKLLQREKEKGMSYEERLKERKKH